MKDEAIPAFDTEITLPIGETEITEFIRAHRQQGFDFVKVKTELHSTNEPGL